MPVRNRTKKQKKRANTTQRGGKRLYFSGEEYTAAEIEKIFCNGKTLAELEKPSGDNRPIFFIKWAPMASGKSSKKVMTIIEHTLAPMGVESCADVTSDKLIENLLPFRYDTMDAKMKNVRIKADLAIKNYSHAKQILQFHRDRLAPVNTNRGTVEKLISEARWSLNEKETDMLLDSLLQKRISQIYNKHYRIDKNSGRKSIREKVVEFFPRAYAEGVNIVYETAGLGYGESEQIGTLMARTRTGRLREKEENPIFKNTFADFLGEVVLAQLEPGKVKPVGIRPISGEGTRPELFIPEKYRIVVIFPIVPIQELVKRGFARAYGQLYHPTFYDVTEEQKNTLAEYITSLISTVTKGSAKPAELRSKLAEILTREFHEHSQLTGEVSYVEDLEVMLSKTKNPEVLKSSFPFFRLTSYDIETAVAQAFQYSIDYFLSQYIQLGRVEQIIYVNNN